MPAIDMPLPDFMTEPELEQFADTVSGFFSREAPPEVVEAWREQGRVDLEMWRKSGEQGLLGVSIPVEYGGGGGDFHHDMIISEQLVKYGLDGFALQLHNVIILPYIQHMGPRIKSRHGCPDYVQES